MAIEDQQQQESRLKERVVSAAEAALSDQNQVGLLDVLMGMGMLAPTNFEAWRRGQLPYVGPLIQVGQKKFESTVKLWLEWAAQKGLEREEVTLRRSTREGPVELWVYEDRDAAAESIFRLHFVRPNLAGRQREKLKEKLEEPKRGVVFQILRDSQCSECGVEIEKGEMLFMEGQEALCLACAKLGDLEFLPSGDAALTRRSTKYSRQPAVVVVRFSRSRGRYERQGILVDVAAIEKAEAECAADAAERARLRARSAETRKADDRKLVENMTARLLELFPGCPPAEAREIAAHTAVRGSGRVGRSEAGCRLEDSALSLAVAAAVRHRKTDYDELLGSGVERSAARSQVATRVEDIVAKWRTPISVWAATK